MVSMYAKGGTILTLYRTLLIINLSRKNEIIYTHVVISMKTILRLRSMHRNLYKITNHFVNKKVLWENN
ncbi:MAG: hypothetical protein ACQEWG_07470 [Bacteroidota bacterium]